MEDWMTGIRELLIDGIEQVNSWWDDALKNLTDEQANWLLPGNTVSIGFNAWHALRTQDDIVNFVLQGRKPTVWMSEGFAERLGLPPVGQGTGMPLGEMPKWKVLRQVVMTHSFMHLGEVNAIKGAQGMAFGI
jgi:hypothetical protein